MPHWKRLDDEPGFVSEPRWVPSGFLTPAILADMLDPSPFVPNAPFGTSAVVQTADYDIIFRGRGPIPAPGDPPPDMVERITFIHRDTGAKVAEINRLDVPGAAVFAAIRNLDAEGLNDLLFAGNDRMWAAGSGRAVEFRGGGGEDSLGGGRADDVLLGGAGNDVVTGMAGDDTAAGGTGDDALLGGTGDDWLQGDAGSDSLAGGAGNDLLEGGAGADALTGGGGADRFVFRDIADSTVAAPDSIGDFKARLGDRIDLSLIDASTLEDGDQAFDYIGSTAFSLGTAGQIRFERIPGEGYRLLLEVDGDGQADMAILVSGPVFRRAPFSDGDFIL